MGSPSIMTKETPAIGIIGGSGLYQMEGVTGASEQNIETPFGSPSDAIIGGKLSGRQVYFLPRHGRGHRILPHELNHRANIYALRSLNVRWIICVTAVGSLQEKYAPRDVLLPSQFYDRTSNRSAHTFFGEGIAAHISFAEPIGTEVAQFARGSGARIESESPQWRDVREHGRAGILHARRIGTQSTKWFRCHRDDEFAGGEACARSGDRAREHGDDHRLRLLEGGRGAGFGGSGIWSLGGERGDGEENPGAGDSENS